MIGSKKMADKVNFASHFIYKKGVITYLLVNHIFLLCGK